MASRRKGPDSRQLGLDALWGPTPAAGADQVEVNSVGPSTPVKVNAQSPAVGSELDVSPVGPSTPLRVNAQSPAVGSELDVSPVGPSTPLRVNAEPPAVDAPASPPSPPLAKVIRLPTARHAPPVDDPFPAWTAPPRPAETSDEQGDEPPEEVSLPQGLRLERNLALLAGAGAGKTYSLVTMCLHLLSGAREGHEPIAGAELGLLTFTDKAAGEMRGRLRERLDALADGRDKELELRASFEEMGRPFPGQAFWRGARDELGAATIGTFHSLCTQLLRRAPPGSGINPNFELLDEREARRLVREVIEGVVLARVQAGHPQVRHLVSEFGFASLVAALTPAFLRIREEGQSPQYVQVSDGAALRRQFDAALLALRTATSQAVAANPRHRLKLEQFSAILRETSFETLPEQVARLRAELLHTRSEPFTRLKQWVRPYDRKDGGAEHNLALLHGACVMAPHEAAVRELLTEVEHLHREALEHRAALDFTGLLVHARDLLRDVPEARRDAQARFRALLVDEFQDTNRLQLELVLLLAERRDGAPRPISAAFEAQHREIIELPLQPAFLAVVGDRKQAIYEFRGADVSVFSTMARCIERDGGGRAFLRHSRRSSPRLVGALNITMARVLAAENYSTPLRDFEVVFAPASDDLVPVRQRQLDVAPYVRLVQPPAGEGAPKTDAVELRAADADAIARYLAASLRAPGAPSPLALASDHARLAVPRRDDEPLRPLRGGDVAMLFQRFTQLEVYRQALVRHGVRHRVVRGRGFFGAQEVVDVACALKLLGEPDDALAFAAVLRSPLVGLPDSALVELALPTPDFPTPGLWPRDVLERGRRPSAADAVSATRLARFVALWSALRAERDRLGLRSLVRALLDGTALRVAVAASPFGEQALANLDKLVELATVRERSGTSVTALGRELLELADAEPTEAQGEVVDELDGDAVTLCTVHQAKGLEWPVVVLPDLAAPPRNEGAAVRFDRLAGLGVKPAATDEGELQSFSMERIADLHVARATAERLRLLYVAMTRARDRVVLGLFGEKPRAGSWAADLRAPLDWTDLRTLTQEVDVTMLPAGAPAVDALLDPAQARDAVARVLERVRHAPAARARRAILAVTQLQDFVGCPRRFWLAHQVGLRDGPAHHGEPALHLDAEVRERGTAAHKLLELTPLDAVGPGLEPTLEAIARAEELDAATPEVLDWVLRFWRGRFGSSLPALGEARVHRELPFVLTLREPGTDFTLLLRGQIDLLVEPADGPLLVIDYKTALAPPAGLDAYRFQLACYALAARRFARGPVQVRSGLVFLREAQPEPAYLDELPDDVALEAQLAAQARVLTENQVTGQWEGRDRPRCEALRCGFVYRCHG